MGDEKTTGIVPPKYDVNAKWDTCIDLTVRRFAYSSLAGAFTGLLFFHSIESVIENGESKAGFGKTKLHGDFLEVPGCIQEDRDSGSPATRWASVAFGAGLGIGSAYSDCSRIFDGSPAKSAPPNPSDAPAPQDGQE